MYKYFKNIGNTELISKWESKGMSNEAIKPPATSDNSLTLTLKYTGKIMYRNFNGSCLKQDKITFNNGKIVKIYIVSDFKSTLNYNRDITVDNFLFGAVKLAKNADIDKYKYSGYGIRFDGCGTFSFPDGSFGQTLIFFGADMSSSVHANNKTKNILILGESITQGLDDTTLTAERKYSINFTVNRRKFCLSLHYNVTNSYLFVNGTEVSEDFCVDNMKITGLIGYVFDFSVDYRTIALDSHKYLMKKNRIVYNVWT